MLRKRHHECQHPIQRIPLLPPLQFDSARHGRPRLRLVYAANHGDIPGRYLQPQGLY